MSKGSFKILALLVFSVVASAFHHPQDKVKSYSGCGNYLSHLHDSASILKVPVMTLRVNAHIVRHPGKKDEFSDDSVHIKLLRRFFGTMEESGHHTLNFAPYSHVLPSNIPLTDSLGKPLPVLKDTRIRFRLMGVYFHNDSFSVDLNGTNRCDNYLYTRYGVNKDSEINIFFIRNKDGKSGGCGPGFINIDGAEKLYLNPDAEYATKLTIAHELGHVLGLPHTAHWSGPCPVAASDPFDDTIYPDASCFCPAGTVFSCPSGQVVTSNNVMGYNQDRIYFSPKQIARMHYTIVHGSNAASGRKMICYVDDAYDSSKFEVIRPLVISSSRVFNGDIVVREGSSLTVSCVLYMKPGSEIIVEKNAKLILEGGKITGLKEDVWKGRLKVHRRGKLINKGGYISLGE
jgi:hypothetical protein